MDRTLLLALVLGSLPQLCWAADPAAAQFNAYSVTELAEGLQVRTDCSLSWVQPKDRRTYCFSSERAKSRFLTDPPGFIARADREYWKLRSRGMLGAHGLPPENLIDEPGPDMNGDDEPETAVPQKQIPHRRDPVQ